MRLLATRGLGVPRGRIVVAMLIRTNLLIALWDSANDGELGRTVNPLPLGLVGSNPTYPTLISIYYDDICIFSIYIHNKHVHS